MNAENIPPDEILVLIRGDYNEAFSRPLKEALRKYNVAFSDPEAVKRMLKEARNRHIIEVFRLLVHREDSLAWAALLRLSGGIGEVFFDYIYGLAQQMSKPVWEDSPRIVSARFPEGTEWVVIESRSTYQRCVEFARCQRDKQG